MFTKASLLVSAITIGLISPPFVSTPPFYSKAEEPKVEIQEYDEQLSSLEERLNMLEFSLVGSTPEETMNRFAEAVKTRNGA